MGELDILSEPSLALAIPYESHIERDIVSLDNGSLLAVLKFEGVFAETASDEELLRWHDSLCSMLMAIASPDLALWRTTHHYALKDFAPGVFDPGTFAHQFNEAYKARCLKEPLFANDLYLAVLIQGAGSLSRMGKGKGGFRQARDEQAAKLDGVCVRIEESLSSYKPRRLGMYRERNIEFSEIYEYLTLLLNGRKFKTPVTPHRAGDILNRSRYYFAKGADTFVRQCSGEREYGALISANTYPSGYLNPGRLNKTLSLPFEYVMTNSFTFMGQQEAKNAVILQERRMSATADDAVNEMHALKELKEGLTTRAIALGRHDLSICITAPDQKTLARRVATAEENCTDNGFIMAREDLALKAALMAQLPGNYKFRPRRAPITTRNYAALAALHNFPTGRRDGNQWGAATTMFLTEGGSPFFASLHDMRKTKTRGGSESEEDKAPGNTLILGPIGGGKTTLQTTLVAQSDKTKPTVFTFDRSQGQYVFVKAMGGLYKVLERGTETGFNPFTLEPNAENIAFASGLVQRLAAGNVGITSGEANEIHKRTLFVMTDEVFDARNLTHLFNGLNGLSGEALERLSQWTETGSNAWCFPSYADQVNFVGNRHFGFDATNFFSDDATRGAIMSYLFHRVNSFMGSGPSIINIDELRAFVKDDYFRDFIEDTLLLNRKRDNIAILGTQQANQVLESKISETLVEQTTTKLLLPNTQAKPQHYMDEGLGLSFSEFELIRDVLPTTNPRAFLFKQPGISTVCNLNLAGMNKELSVLSGTDKLNAVMKLAIAESSDDPRSWLPIYYDMLRN